MITICSLAILGITTAAQIGDAQNNQMDVKTAIVEAVSQIENSVMYEKKSNTDNSEFNSFQY